MNNHQRFEKINAKTVTEAEAPTKNVSEKLLLGRHVFVDCELVKLSLKRKIVLMMRESVQIVAKNI